MAQLLAGFAQKLSRLFLGRITVHSLKIPQSSSVICVKNQRSPVAVLEVRSTSRVIAACFVKWRETQAKTAGKLMEQIGEAEVKTLNFKRVNLSVKRIKLRLNKVRPPYNGIERIAKLPIYRRNRLNFIKNPPKIERGVLLALYSPIFREWLVKSVLDKSEGSLLVWYKAGYARKDEEPHHLLLIRVYGTQEPLQWVWLSVSSSR